MCDERERLIGYVYDECDGDDRTQIDRHLESCATCREEIASLRATRQDLLAWEVPDHGSVWRPFVPVRLTPWYRAVPAWAMATAAGLIFAIGLGGGVTAQAIMASRTTAPPPTQAATTVSLPQSDTTTSTQTAAVRAELAALEARMLSLNGALSRHMVAADASDGLRAVSVADSDIVLNDQMRNVSVQVTKMWINLRELQEQNRQLSNQVAQLATLAGAGGSSR